MTAAPSYKFNSEEQITWERTTRKKPCRKCGRYGWCETSSDGKTAHCMYEGEGPESRYRGGGWFHTYDTAYSGATAADLRVKAAPKEEAKRGPLTDQEKDKVFRRLLELFPLSYSHKEYLGGEGVNPAGCGTFTRALARKIAAQIVDEFGVALAALHPALKLEIGNKSSTYWTIAAYADGILFPALNERTGLIAGCQLRKDNPRGKSDRYVWVSSGGKGGTPLTVFTAPADSDFKTWLLVTEGYKKARSALKTLRLNTISIAGVTSFKIDDILAEIDALKITDLALAFDLDKRTNPRVERAEQNLIWEINQARPGLKLHILNWQHETEPKGLDDGVGP